MGLRGHRRWTWGGAASTFFFIDPDQDVTAIFVTQKFPFDFAMGAGFNKAVLEAVATADATTAAAR
jgi:CubicO group peptidase (beta-lactamase class C family)